MTNNLANKIKTLESLKGEGPRVNLNYLKKAFSLLELDLSKIKKIHIAGTNGKGSTSLYLTNILKDNNLTIGTFISPYLISFNERILLNGINISNKDLEPLITYILNFHDMFYLNYHKKLSFFELLTLMAFKYFYEKKVDVMIIEAGIGGLFDVTNILNYDLSLITNIGLDHQKQLGNTLEEIAFNKLGIVKENNHLITTVSNSFYDQFVKYLKKVRATYQFIDLNSIKIINNKPLIFSYQNEEYELPLLGNYQALNAVLSISAAKYLYPNLEIKSIKKSLLKTKYYGRLEELMPNLYLDGAHNENAIKALVNAFRPLKKDKLYVLFSSLSDKDHHQMLELLKDISDEIIITTFPDFRFKEIINEKHQIIKDPEKALNYLLSKKNKDDIILVTGSIHFIGYIKNMVEGKEND